MMDKVHSDREFVGDHLQLSGDLFSLHYLLTIAADESHIIYIEQRESLQIVFLDSLDDIEDARVFKSDDLEVGYLLDITDIVLHSIFLGLRHRFIRPLDLGDTCAFHSVSDEQIMWCHFQRDV
jgi:hypothetical protein